MKVITTDRVDPASWNRFVESHPFGSIYHHSLWQNVIQKTYGYRPLYNLILDDASQLQAATSSAFVNSTLTGKRITAYPFSDSCDPLVKDCREAETLLRSLENLRSRLGAGFVEVRLAHAFKCMDTEDRVPEYYSHLLPLDPGPEALLESFHKNCILRAIRNGQRRNVEIRLGCEPRHLEAFYDLHLMTRKKHGVPVQPFRFFKNLWEAFAPMEMLTLLLARHHRKWVAGIIVLWFKGHGYYKFGASDDRMLHLRANQMLMWEAIQLALEKGCTLFDFGRTSSSNTGLCQYKRRWGAHQVPLHYFRDPPGHNHGVLNELSRKHSLLKNILSRMPSMMARISGELFYRHFA